MMYYLKLYAATFLGFLAIDIVWLAFVARGFYKKQLGFLFSDQLNWWAAVIFYLLFIAGLLVFAVSPGLQAGSLRKTLLLGAFFGLCRLRRPRSASLIHTDGLHGRCQSAFGYGCFLL